MSPLEPVFLLTATAPPREGGSLSELSPSSHLAHANESHLKGELGFLGDNECQSVTGGGVST